MQQRSDASEQGDHFHCVS